MSADAEYRAGMISYEELLESYMTPADWARVSLQEEERKQAAAEAERQRKLNVLPSVASLYQRTLPEPLIDPHNPYDLTADELYDDDEDDFSPFYDEYEDTRFYGFPH
jgi:hypothetical protein